MTNAELAVLSLVAESPRHGYEIEQVIDARGMRDWTEVGFSSIYYLLKKLENKSLIKSQHLKIDGRGPARKVYTITPDGQQVHQNEVRLHLIILLEALFCTGCADEDVVILLENHLGGIQNIRIIVNTENYVFTILHGSSLMV